MLRRLLCRLLVPALLALPAPGAQAELIATDRAAARDSPLQGREEIRALLNRQEVQRRLQQLGVDPRAAVARVEAMTDGEIATLSRQFDAMRGDPPAAGWEDWTDVFWIVLSLLLVVVAGTVVIGTVGPKLLGR